MPPVTPIDSLTVSTEMTLGVGVGIVGALTGYALGQGIKRGLRAVDVDEWMEGTQFNRGLAKVNLTTVTLVSTLVSAFVYVLTAFVALNLAGVLSTGVFWTQTIRFLPQVLIASVTLITGVVLGDRALLHTQNYLEQFKLPQSVLIPRLIKYSIVYVAALLALSQVGVQTAALLALLVVYMAGILLMTAIAGKQFLTAGTAGIYLLFATPYTIGDTISIGQQTGIVQEVTVLFTTLESGDGTVFHVPNNHVFEHGIVHKSV